MRLFKSEEELNVMRRAGEISALAHTRAMEKCRPGMFEYQLEGEIHHEFNRHGARLSLLQHHCRRRGKRLHSALHRKRKCAARRRSGAD
jgi:Xaa-Pro aminopeptidase